MDIVINGYPKNGTFADVVVNGVTGSRIAGYENGYTVYVEPIRSTPRKILAFKDARENNVVVEIEGSWSIRNQINHGIAQRYMITFSFDKSLNVDYREIDDAVSKFISAMYVGNN
ncbi:hypothetical protein [Trinickia mobilis]|uniref:hypothetical protein n=1 Tax=Trinickia mobilis TaxID=2816356 RepID=UPI001A904A3E|nr:hypothetical protein [Trinickia mobilis]